MKDQMENIDHSSREKPFTFALSWLNGLDTVSVLSVICWRLLVFTSQGFTVSSTKQIWLIMSKTCKLYQF
jgi:predicted component of type VI protein secretion system